ncbi:nucleoporin autopeptidase [Colletotrichum orchidophilum]|uniref:Nucleoporin autopeptidase n=1 Tax=Colletotrichum orchidophilum TaxID=1209926 RepID=A0A1G4AWG3_9PEZI|nr:nucleoporin autopeptidase [Colletotrichum orchidophilum]OHE93446.1 nucleoporin autopeptidase [Colletotrichum orchidophilum]
MSGFGSTGFGGFGSTNNQQSTGFGGFGAANTTNTNSGFGSGSTTNNAFGSTGTSTGGGLFGGSGTTGAFGGTSTGFGSNTGTSTFGAAKPAFGATPSAGGGLFGASGTTNTATPSTGFGGFGSNTTTTNTSSPFGGASGGGLFGGANKPAFGSGTANATSGTSLFGGNASSGFGGATNTAGGGFGATMNPGIGSNIGDPPGTALSPFQAHQEKETTGAGNQSNSFQNILFQEPYKKWSSDELRLADYAQGRRHGNASGTGAFGVSNFGSGGFGAATNQQSTGFGTVAASGGGLFGSGTNNTTNTAATTSGFGGGSNGGFGAGGGGLFGNNAAKPATGGGLFGSGTTTTAAPAQSGGLFGGSSGGAFGSTGTTGGFGATTNNTGGGLFGSNNNNTATQNKPSGFSFGNTGTTTGGFGNTPSTGFGSNNNAAGNTSTTGGLFGGNTGQATSGGLFGNNQSQPQQQNTGSAFGGGGFGQTNPQTGGGGLFGNTQQKPATGGGLFGGGGATTSGGLFGGGNTSSTSFGTTNTNTNTGGGLFGAKPAATGGGLFGSNPTGQANNTGGGLFGGGLAQNNQPQQQTGQSSLFGGAQNQTKPGGLFGSSQPAGSGMFGGQNNQQQGIGLFGSTNQQQQQQQPQHSLFGGSLLGNSQGVSQGPQSLTANINDVSAYGSPSLFSNLGGSETPNPGPLATPLSSKSKPRRSSILPMYKLNPASAARFVTPQKRGFGFSYSTYGTPGGSPSSAASTPGGASRSLLGSSSFNRSLSKSVSTSNLRRSFNAEDSILAPGAFSASSGPRYYGQNGSVKKLIINKDMRSDLFSTPTKERPSADLVNGSRKLSKRVSFDTSTMDAPEVDDHDSVFASTPRVGAVVQESTPVSANVNGSKSASASGDPDPSKGKELAIVHEEDTSSQAPEVSKDGLDAAPGAYWMSPTKEVLAGMNRVQRQQVTNFTIGRDNVGSVRFKVPVDLTNIDLDEIFGGIVILETRSATVYPIAAKKPPVGKGLNVPALISLEQSWPRGRDKRPSNDAKRFNKHVERLRRIEDTTFESYNTETGVWKFSVEHFTTYGLEYDEDDDEPEQPAVVHPHEQVSFSNASQQDSHDSESSPREDDTFDFRRNKRRALPGAFDHRDEDFGGEYAQRSSQRQSFLGDSFAGSTSNALILSTEEETDEQDNGYGTSEDEDMLGTPVRRHLAAEQPIDSPEGDGNVPTSETPGGILRARMRALKGSATPMKLQVAGGDEWMDMLQRSVSPQKRDRAFLRIANETASCPPAEEAEAASRKSRVVSDGRGFATSIDLMNSLFEKAKAPPAPAPTRGFVQWPYERQTKSFVDQSDMSDADQAFHNSMRPSWGPDGTLLFASTCSSLEDAGKQITASSLMITKNIIQAQGREIQAAKFSNEDSAKALENHIRMTNVELVGGVPKLSLHPGPLKSLFHDQNLSNPANAHEKLVWDLASILFDGDASTVPRRSTLSQFWATIVDTASSRSVALARSSEEKAIAALSGHRVQDACKHLLDGKNFHLATLVSLIGSNDQSKKDMREQVSEWQEANFLSEFADPVRAIYEILSGNVCVCEGKKEAPLHDRIESFVISERFGLDWKQAFGLRLWYSISREDDLSAAVRVFQEDVAQDKEQRPQTWYVEQGIPALWEDHDQDLREDLLWGLLKLYANKETDLEAVLRPENSQLSPLDARLSWQLSRALLSTRKVSYGHDAIEKADALTISFADQLINEGSWLEATFVLLHLCQSDRRAKAVQENLCRHAGLLGPENGSNFATLAHTLKVPASWIWNAQALYMRAVKKDAAFEVQCLLRAGSYPEAHEVFVHKVAPCAVISRDYDELASILSPFEGHKNDIAGWTLGGEVYKAFLELVDRRRQRQQVTSSTLEKLVTGLPAMREHAESANVTSLAAISEMSSTVAKVMMETSRQDQDVPRVLGLPVTEDSHLKHSLYLGLSYYEGLMAGAR